MKAKKVSPVFETNDYSSFKKIKGNRGIDPQHVNRLEHSFKKKHLKTPILLNEKMEIVDGQHRVEAAKNLNLPVYYIIKENYGLDEARALNS
ncbi:MAG: ParB N-terminal domain-containing protein [Cyclobacteriaceae bacterium]